MTKDDKYYEVSVDSICRVLFRPDAFYVASDLRYAGEDSVIYVPDELLIVRVGTRWINLITGDPLSPTSIYQFEKGYMYLAKNWQGYSW